MAEKRLIDANALKKAFSTDMRIINFDGTRMGAGGFLVQRYQVVGLIDDAPTVDAVPVVHAYWMDDIICSHCRSTKARPWAAYLEQRANTFCHVCGAKMDAKEE